MLRFREKLKKEHADPQVNRKQSEPPEVFDTVISFKIVFHYLCVFDLFEFVRM